MTDDAFDLATKYQKYREIKGFGITYIHDSAIADGAPTVTPNVGGH